MAVKRLTVFAALALGFFVCLGGAFIQIFGDPFAAASAPAVAQPPSTSEPSSTPEPRPSSTATPLPSATQVPTETPVPTATPTASSTPPPPSPISLPANYGPSYYPPGVNPLSGLVLADPAILERRPLAIKITNYPRRVRPQSGITLADLVFEYYIETGLTRFIAVFYGNDAEQVGPVRSGRFFDEHVVRMYNAIFAFASADKRVLEPWLESDLAPRLVIPRVNNCPPLCRDQNNPDYNNLYTNTAQLGAYVEKRGVDNQRYDLTGMRFQTIVPWGGELGMQIFVRYSRLDYNNWQFNPATGQYQRFEEAEDDTGEGEIYAPMFDRLTGRHVTADNVVVLMVPHEDFIKSGTTEIVKINLTGFGPATIFRNGRAYEGVWVRVAEDKPLQILRSLDGAAFPLKPGRTFFQVIGASSNVVQDGSTWRFTFHIP